MSRAECSASQNHSTAFLPKIGKLRKIVICSPGENGDSTYFPIFLRRNNGLKIENEVSVHGFLRSRR